MEARWRRHMTKPSNGSDSRCRSRRPPGLHGCILGPDADLAFCRSAGADVAQDQARRCCAFQPLSILPMRHGRAEKAVHVSNGSKPEVAALRRDVCFTLASAGELPLEKHVAVVAALIRPVLLWVFSDVGAGNDDVPLRPDERTLSAHQTTSEKCHCIGIGAFVSPSGAFVVYDPMSRIR
jgi:hypothetical protein